ncbi:MAG: ATP-binding cassette domain-containing protein, partial [Legionellaceae bacterium]|nr:ATP-binding cassette domain-containing protein [Legionellaceae bacterium]
MSKYQISIQDFSLSYQKNLLLDAQSVTICSGQRIGIIGRNGAGKSSLLRFLYDTSVNQFKYQAQYVPQLLDQHEGLSGGEHLIKRIYAALLQEPEILFLDEPTNHLDQRNRKLIFKALAEYSGTLMFVSHDMEMLNQSCDEIWQIESYQINKFQGNYQHFCRERDLVQAGVERLQSRLKQQEKENHASLMREQNRASKAKKKGIKSIKSNKYATIKSPTKVDRGNQTANTRKLALKEDRKYVTDKKEQLFSIKKIVPSFNLTWQKTSGPIVHVQSGSIGYKTLILDNINLVINAGEKIWLQGNNGSGKSTFVKALRNMNEVNKAACCLISKCYPKGFSLPHK